VSHADLLCAVPSVKDGSSPLEYGPPLIVRPKFSKYKLLTDRCLEAIRGRRSGAIPSSIPSLPPAAASSASSSSNTLPPSSTSSQLTSSSSRSCQASYFPSAIADQSQESLPYGWSFGHDTLEADVTDNFHFKSGDRSKRGLRALPKMLAVYVPLIAVMVRRWLRQQGVYDPHEPTGGRRYLLYLVSGHGTPQNQALPQTSNSTQSTARIIAEFVKTFYPCVEPILIETAPKVCLPFTSSPFSLLLMTSSFLPLPP
jgi:hypothetical protein